MTRPVKPGRIAARLPHRLSGNVSKALCLPETITLLLLPPYAPDPNPIENVRACLRANRLARPGFETDAEIVERCCDARNFFAGDIEAVKSITSRDYAKAVNR